MMSKLYLCIVFFLTTVLCVGCGRLSKQQSEEGVLENNLLKEEIIRSKRKEPKSDCRDRLNYFGTSQKTEFSKWSSQKKRRLLSTALREIWNTNPSIFRSWKNTDSGKILVNIVSHPDDEDTRKFLLKDREFEIEVRSPEDKVEETRIVKTWSGTIDGIEEDLIDEPGEAYCMLWFLLTAWGKVNDKDVVVFSYAEGRGACFQHVPEHFGFETNWAWIPWTSYGMDPVHTIIMWKNKGVWKSTVKSKPLDPLNIEEICNELMALEGK